MHALKTKATSLFRGKGQHYNRNRFTSLPFLDILKEHDEQNDEEAQMSAALDPKIGSQNSKIKSSDITEDFPFIDETNSCELEPGVSVLPDALDNFDCTNADQTRLTLKRTGRVSYTSGLSSSGGDCAVGFSVKRSLTTKGRNQVPFERVVHGRDSLDAFGDNERQNAEANTSNSDISLGPRTDPDGMAFDDHIVDNIVDNKKRKLRKTKQGAVIDLFGDTNSSSSTKPKPDGSGNRTVTCHPRPPPVPKVITRCMVNVGTSSICNELEENSCGSSKHGSHQSGNQSERESGSLTGVDESDWDESGTISSSSSSSSTDEEGTSSPKIHDNDACGSLVESPDGIEE